MSTDKVNVMQESDKNAMTERPEADEDARTESSDDSNSQQQVTPDVDDSEDEFEDAVAPPSSTSSTSSMMLVFDGNAPPLSGVYEDALEATEEQVAAALGSTSSDGGRQSTVLEGDEEDEENVMQTEDALETEEVVKGIMETAVAAMEDVAAEAEAEPLDHQVLVQQELASDANAMEEFSSPAEARGVEVVTKKVETERVNAHAVITSDEVGDMKPVDEASKEDGVVNSTGVEAKEESSSVANCFQLPLAIESDVNGEKAIETVSGQTTADTVAGETAVGVDKSTVAETEELAATVGVTAEDSADEVAENEDVIVETSEEEQVSDADERVVEAEETNLEDISNANAMGRGNAKMATNEETAEADTIVEQTELSTFETTSDGTEQSVAVGAQNHEAGAVEETTTDESVEVDVAEAPVEEVVADEKDTALEDPVAEAITEEKLNASTGEAAAFDGEIVDAVVPDANPEGEEGLVEEQDEAAQMERNSSENITVAVHVDVEEIVVQVTEEPVEAVQREQDTEKIEELVAAEALEDKSTVEAAVQESDAEDAAIKTPDVPELSTEGDSSDKTAQELERVDNDPQHVVADPEDEAVATKQDPAHEHEAEAAPLNAAAEPASVSKETYSKDGDDDNQKDIVHTLLPRLAPSSGATTSTSIEPFSVTAESLEVHFPPQRWIYEVYGFSIENRVVYYHTHKTDRRTGIRDPPVLKRYTDFRELQIQLLDTCVHATAGMPLVPRPHLGTVFRGYKSKKTIEIREKAFRSLLRYISQYPELHGSRVFERFIETSRVPPGARWM